MSLASFSPLTPLLPPGISITEGLELFFQIVQDTFTTNLVAGEWMNPERCSVSLVYRYALAAAVTWIGYDICLTFADEVRVPSSHILMGLCATVHIRLSSFGSEIQGFQLRCLFSILPLTHGNRARWTLSKLLYICGRYYGFVAAL